MPTKLELIGEAFKQIPDTKKAMMHTHAIAGRKETTYMHVSNMSVRGNITTHTQECMPTVTVLLIDVLDLYEMYSPKPTHLFIP